MYLEHVEYVEHILYVEYVGIVTLCYIMKTNRNYLIIARFRLGPQRWSERKLSNCTQISQLSDISEVLFLDFFLSSSSSVDFWIPCVLIWYARILTAHLRVPKFLIHASGVYSEWSVEQWLRCSNHKSVEYTVCMHRSMMAGWKVKGWILLIIFTAPPVEPLWKPNGQSAPGSCLFLVITLVCWMFKNSFWKIWLKDYDLLNIYPHQKKVKEMTWIHS